MTQEELKTIRESIEKEHCGNCGEPRVYVGTYHKYACGDLTGVWLNLDSFNDYDEFIETCRMYHSDEDDPELMLQDYENYPDAWYNEGELSEETFGNIIEYWLMDDGNKDAFNEYIDEIDHKMTPSEFRHKTYFSGSLRDLAEQIVDEELSHASCVSDLIKNNIDYDGVANDLGYDYTETQHFVFSDY